MVEEIIEPESVAVESQGDEALDVVEPQLDVQQVATDLETLLTPAEVPEELPEDRYASLVGSFTKLFQNKVLKKQQSIKRGEEAHLKRLAEESAVEQRAREIDETLLTDLEEAQPHQINFDTINDADDVKATIGKMNDINRVEIQDQRRNIVSDEELKGLSDTLSSDPETIKKVLGLKPGEILPPEYILSMKQVLTQSGGRLRELSRRIMDGEASDKEQIQFHKQWEFHSQFTQQFMGVRAEYGRGLRALGVNVDDSVPMGELMNRLSAGTLDTRTMAEQINMAVDDKSLANVIQAQKGWFSKTTDVFHEVFISGILSGVQTHIVNTTSNALKTISMPLDTAVASMIKADGTDVITKGEGMAQLKGIMESNYEALQMAWRVGKTGEAYGGASKLDVDYVKAISANALGIKEGTTMASVVDNAGKVVRFSTDNMMGAEDAFFKVLNENGKLRQIAHRKAMKQGLSGDEYNDFVSFAMANPTQDMRQQATMAGLESTYQQELGRAGKGIQNLRSSVPGARFVMPFIKTPINLIYEGFVERTPLAMMSKKYTDALREGGAAAQMAKAKLITGTAFNSALVGVAMNGQTTGDYPKDPKMRQVMKDAGVQESSFVFVDDKGNKEYLSFDRLEPFNSILKLYANINQTISMANLDGENPEAEKELGKLAAGLGVALTEATVNQTFMSGLRQIIEVMNDPGRYSKSFIQNMMNSVLIPQSSLLRGITRELDPIARDAQGILDNINKNIPGMSEQHVPQLDNYGKPITYDHNLVPAFWKFGVEGSTDKVYQETLRVAEMTKTVPVHKPKKTIGGYRMTAEEYHFYTDRATNAKRSGKNLYSQVKTTMNSREYKRGNDYVKAMFLRDIRDAYYDIAKAELMKKFPHIQKYGLDKKEYQFKLLGGE